MRTVLHTRSGNANLSTKMTQGTLENRETSEINSKTREIHNEDPKTVKKIIEDLNVASRINNRWNCVSQLPVALLAQKQVKMARMNVDLPIQHTNCKQGLMPFSKRKEPYNKKSNQ
jgi:hypothetical protein